MTTLESHCPEFAEAAGRLVERLRLKAADVEQKEVVATNHTKSNTSSKNASNNEPGETHKALPHARCALEEAIESAPKTVLLAYLNGIHQLLPVTDETVSHDSPVEVTIVYSEPLDALCTAELRHGFSVVRQSIEHRTAAKRVPKGSTVDHLQTTAKEKIENSKATGEAIAEQHAQFFPQDEDVIGLGFSSLDIAQGRIEIKQIEVCDFYKLVKKGQVDHTRALFASTTSPVEDSYQRLACSWILYDSPMWRSLVERLPKFNDFASIRLMSRNVGFALGAMKRLKNQRGFSDPVARKCTLALSLYRVHTVRECLCAVPELAIPVATYAYPAADAERKVVETMRHVVDGSLPEADVLKMMSDAQSSGKKLTAMFKKSKQKKKSSKQDTEDQGEDQAIALPSEVRFDQFDDWLGEFRVRMGIHGTVAPRLFNGGVPIDKDSLLPSLESPNVRALHEKLKALDLPLDVSQILFMCQSGSAMYGLNVSTSDKDYTIVFAVNPTGDFARCDPAPRSMISHHVSRKDSQDKSDVVEFTAVDVQKYGEFLLKGNAKNVEPLYLEGPPDGETVDMNSSTFVYESPLWRLLKGKRDLFVTNRAIAQYIGFVIMQLKLLEKPSPKHRKLLYYAYHKIFELRRMLRGEAPHVRVRDDERNFILEIRRTDPTEGRMSTAKLKERAQRELDEIVAEFEKTKDQRSDEGDFEVILEWVLLARAVYER